MAGHSWEIIGTIGAAVTTSIIGPIVFEHIKRNFFKNKDEDIVTKDINKNIVIIDDLALIREELNGDRIWITQFHNGGHFLHSNKSIQKFSITYEDTKPGVSSAIYLFKDIPLSLYCKAMTELVTTGNIFIPDFSDETIATFGLKPAAEATGTRASYVVTLYDIATNKCIGTLGIDYREPKVLTEIEQDFLIDRANRLAGYLSVFLQMK